MSDCDSECMETDTNNDNQKSLRSRTKRQKQNAAANKPKKVIHDDVPNDVQINISTANQFEILQNTEGEVILQRNNQRNTANKTRKERVPPIIISPPTSRKSVEFSLNSIAVSKYQLKHASSGLYLYVESIDDHKKVRETFKASGIPFYSHDLPEDKVAKVVLIGLDKMEPKELTGLIKQAGFDPVDIKVMTPKKARYTDHVNYLVYFKRDSTDLKKLYKTKVLNHTVIRWEPYRSNRATPTQCRRCQRPGHGTRHCEMPPRCMYCPGEHLSSKCTAIKMAYDVAKAKEQATGVTNPAPKLIDDFKPTCCNCKGNHLASDPGCPEWKRFQEIQAGIAQKNQRQANKRFNYKQDEFPQTLNSRSQPQQHIRTTPALTSHQRPTYSQVASTSFIAQQQPNALNDGDCSEDLFSFTEINSLINEMMTSLSKCKSKADQFQVISHLALKYVYGHK